MSLTDIYNFWFDNEDIWFSSTPETDKIISDKFSPILLNPPEISTTWTHQESIGYILLFDQITRHVNRNNSKKEEKERKAKQAELKEKEVLPRRLILVD